MSETAVKTYSKDAERLYQRGMAAARGGQRRIAAGLLTRAVQLDPRHEGAWLWLSGVLDDPHDVAFCLRTALQLNPENQRARKALLWLEQRKLQEQPAQPISTIRSISLEPAPEREHEQPFWAQFRSWVRMQSLLRMGRIGGVTLLFVLVMVTALLTEKAARRPLPTPAQQSVGTGSAAVPQQVLAHSPENERAALLAFLSEITEIRTHLNAAQATYREVANTSSTAVAQVAAVKQYHGELAAAAEDLRAITPPEPLRDAYQHLLAGIDIEQEALVDLQSFYSEYNVALANRAALRLQDASSSYQQAQAVWDAYSTQIAEQSPSSSFELR